MPCACSKPMPNAMQMAVSAADAGVRLFKAAVTGEQIVAGADTVTDRMAVCRECDMVKLTVKDNQTFHRCSLCGCWLDGKHLAKARLATESCPLGKWGAM